MKSLDVCIWANKGKINKENREGRKIEIRNKTRKQNIAKYIRKIGKRRTDIMKGS